MMTLLSPKLKDEQYRKKLECFGEKLIKGK